MTRSRGGSGYFSEEDRPFITTEPYIATDFKTSKKWMIVRDQKKERRVAWYTPCESVALDALLRGAFSLTSETPYLLLDDTMTAVAVSSSLPSGHTFELFLPPPTISAARNRAIVVVDPISTGAVLAHQIVNERQHQVIAVWSDVIPSELMGYVDARCAVEFAGSIKHAAGCLDATVNAIRALGLEVSECMVGCETGVLLTDQLTAALGCRGNGTAKSSLRRNKYLQTEAIRSAGLNACGQVLANSVEDVDAFLSQMEPSVGGAFKAVVKPVEGAGSDGVSICESPEAVRSAFAALEGTKNVLGLDNYAVLLQEYLRGDEYVVDTVSRSGVHKCVAIWRYDKRRFNGSSVVYYGMRLLPIDAEPQLATMVRYVFGVLDAIGIRNGAIHSEVKIEERGPVLIEANCRLHGGEGTWAPMAEACLGYSAVSAMLDAYLDPLAFATIPPMPSAFRAHAKEAKLRSAVSGVLREIDEEAMAEIRGLSSYQSEMLSASVGTRIEKTIDLLTSYGNVNLVNESLEQLEADYASLHEIVARGIFKVE